MAATATLKEHGSPEASAGRVGTAGFSRVQSHPVDLDAESACRQLVTSQLLAYFCWLNVDPNLRKLTYHINDIRYSSTARSGSAVVTGVALALVVILIALQQVIHK